MRIRPKRHLLLTLVVLSMTLAMSASAHAQERLSQAPGGLSATLQINFGSSPHWAGYPGSGVRVIRERDRPAYDMFQFRGRYYVYSNDAWYVSRRWRGQFTAIDDRAVPRELFNVPREHWRHYPTGWMDRKRDDRSDDRGRGRTDDRNAESAGKRGHK